jgi:putative endonuclease
MSKGFMYILECSDGSFYTGSTRDLEKRFRQHQNSLGANYTRNRLPVRLVYYEEYDRIDEAFYREKQIQGWSHAKKKALIEGNYKDLKLLAKKRFGNKGHLDKIPPESLDDRKSGNNSPESLDDQKSGNNSPESLDDRIDKS